MTSEYGHLAAAIGTLMKQQADALVRVDEADRRREQERDAMVREIMEVLDSTERAASGLSDPLGRQTVGAIALQLEELLRAGGFELISFNRGDLPPLDQIEVTSTVAAPDLEELAVVRMVRRGVRSGGRIVRRAAVEVCSREGAVR